MSATIDAVYEEALGLTDDSRMELVERLITSIGCDPDLESEQLAVVRRRMQEVENGSVRMIPAEEVFRRIRESNGFTNLEYRLGDLEEPPIVDASVDLVFLSQSLHHAARPDRAVCEAFRITKPGGRIVILDLLKHDFEQARELYADLWLGFAEVELHTFLEAAGFQPLTVRTVDRESEPPHFQTLLAIGLKPG